MAIPVVINGVLIQNFPDEFAPLISILQRLQIAADDASVQTKVDDAVAALGAVVSPVASKAVAAGEVVLDGTNPTAVSTGLSAVDYAVVSIKASATPGDDPVLVTADYGGAVPDGEIAVYAWKTNGTDPTLVASTNNTATVSWMAYGDPA